MPFEIEIKYRVPDHEAVRERLRVLGAEAGTEIDQEDVYLAHPARDFALTDEAFRIRRVGHDNRLTYKGPKRAGPTKTREEIEIPFEEGPGALDRMKTLFERLGFRPVATIHKARSSFRLSYQGREIEIVLDSPRDLGTFAEVEAIAATEADLAEAQKAVVSLSRELGLSEVEPRSYLRMSLEHRDA